MEASGEFFRSVPDDHPAFPGHFPGRPIVPGVVLLDWAVRGVCRALGRPEAPCRIVACKFLSPAGPGERLRTAWRREADGSARFEIGAEQDNSRIVATGKLAWPAQEVLPR